MTTSEKVYFYISVSGDYSGSVGFTANVAEVAPVQIQAYFFVISSSVQPSKIRETTTQKIDFMMPKGKVKKNGYFFIEYFYSPYSQIWKPLCKLVRVEDQTSYNWLSGCTFIDSRKLKLTFKSNDQNSTFVSKQYQISISNGPTPLFLERNSAKNDYFFSLYFTTASDASAYSISSTQNQLSKITFSNDLSLKRLQFSYKNINSNT